jgi:hypothetical protein
MTIQNVPPFFDMLFTKPDGHLSADGYLYNDQLSQAISFMLVVVNSLATSISKDTLGIKAPAIFGINAPSFTTAQITSIAPSTPYGTIFYDKDIKKLKVWVESAIPNVGEIQTIQSV